MKPIARRCPKCGSPPLRSIEQNARLWPMLRAVSQQVIWHGQRLNEWEWKDVFTAAMKRQRVVPGLDGGFVVLGEHTSRMSTEQMSDLMMLIEAFGAEHGVDFDEREAA